MKVIVLKLSSKKKFGINFVTKSKLKILLELQK